MTEEIKEILKDIFKDENVNGFILSDERYKELKDYITNLQQENQRIKTFIDEIIKTLKHCKLNGTNKLDIVGEFIEKEYNEQINGSGEE